MQPTTSKLAYSTYLFAAICWGCVSSAEDEIGEIETSSADSAEELNIEQYAVAATPLLGGPIAMAIQDQASFTLPPNTYVPVRVFVVGGSTVDFLAQPTTRGTPFQISVHGRVEKVVLTDRRNADRDDVTAIADDANPQLAPIPNEPPLSYRGFAKFGGNAAGVFSRAFTLSGVYEFRVTNTGRQSTVFRMSVTERGPSSTQVGPYQDFLFGRLPFGWTENPVVAHARARTDCTTAPRTKCGALGSCMPATTGDGYRWCRAHNQRGSNCGNDSRGPSDNMSCMPPTVCRVNDDCNFDEEDGLNCVFTCR